MTRSASNGCGALALAAALLLFPPLARADEAAIEAAVARPRPARQHAYLELGGRGGLYGLGLERRLGAAAHLGLTLSLHRLGGLDTFVLSPYLGLRPLRRGRHGSFLELGPRWVRQEVASPVASWAGATTNTVGAALSFGYRYEGPVVVRAYLMATVGEGGAAPWAGTSLGWSF